MKRIKLRWYIWRLRVAYKRWRDMLDQVDCGADLLKHISPEFARQDAKVERLLNKCRGYESHFQAKRAVRDMTALLKKALADLEELQKAQNPETPEKEVKNGN